MVGQAVGRNSPLLVERAWFGDHQLEEFDRCREVEFGGMRCDPGADLGAVLQSIGPVQQLPQPAAEACHKRIVWDDGQLATRAMRYYLRFLASRRQRSDYGSEV